MKNVSIIVPTLNEAENIKNLLGGLLKFDFIKEIIFIDAHSKDGTEAVVRSYMQKHGEIKFFLQESRGKGAALKEGFRKAAGDILVVIDADLSHDISKIPALIRPIQGNEVDAVLASRFMEGAGSEDITRFRLFGNWVFCSLMNLFWHANFTDSCYGFRAFRREMLQKLELSTSGFETETEISIEIAKKKIRFIEIPSFEYARKAGTGKLRTFQDGYRILSIIFRKLL